MALDVDPGIHPWFQIAITGVAVERNLYRNHLLQSRIRPAGFKNGKLRIGGITNQFDFPSKDSIGVGVNVDFNGIALPDVSHVSLAHVSTHHQRVSDDDLQKRLAPLHYVADVGSFSNDDAVYRTGNLSTLEVALLGVHF